MGSCSAALSAIDFDFTMERLPDPKGDRVKIGRSGKFLPFKYYGTRATSRRRGIRRSEKIELTIPESEHRPLSH